MYSSYLRYFTTNPISTTKLRGAKNSCTGSKAPSSGHFLNKRYKKNDQIITTQKDCFKFIVFVEGQFAGNDKYTSKNKNTF